MQHRNLLGRLFEACLLIFIAALLVYGAVQLVRAVVWWLVGFAAVGVSIGLIAALIRHRNERW